MSESPLTVDYIQITADIVAAFVSNNAVRASELPAVIEAVHSSLLKAVEIKAEEPVVESKAPAVPVKKSITDDFIICLEDGKKFKSLKRHLSTAYNMTPEEYRTKWGLARDYPMVAPAYASARSNLARQMGLGRKRDETGEDMPMAQDTPMMDDGPVTEDMPMQDMASAEVVEMASPPMADEAKAEPARKRGRPRGVKAA